MGYFTIYAIHKLRKYRRKKMQKENVFSGIAGAHMYDTEGKMIQAHGGQIQKFTVNGTTRWYWIGEDKTDGYRPCGGIHLYSSTDLFQWKDEGIILKTMDKIEDFGSDYFKKLYGTLTQSQKETIFTDLDKHNCVIERPKMIYNKKTNKYIIWFHADGRCPESDGDYGKAKAGVAISDNPTSPFRLIGTYKLNYHNDPTADYGFDGWQKRGSVRDMTLFKDKDDTAYIIYSSEGNRTTYISKLNDEYTALAKQPEEAAEGTDFTRNFIGKFREAHTIFQYKNKYYLIQSGCTGWLPNPASYAVADHPMGPWKDMGDPCTESGRETTYDSQSTYVIPIDEEKGQYIYMGDRWNEKDLADSRYIWLPIVFLPENKIKIQKKQNWKFEKE